MTKSLLTVLLCLFFITSCKKTEKQKLQHQTEKHIKTTDSTKVLTMLDSIRQNLHEYYKEYDELNTDTISTQLSASKNCTPCDMKFLVYLSKKDDYNLKDIKTLLCLDDKDVCDDNAEFVAFYNEMVFKVFDRERKDLSFKQIDSLLQDHELVEELESPTSEVNSKSLITLLKKKN